MTTDRKGLACFVVGIEAAPQDYRWCVLNEDRAWLAAIDAERGAKGEKIGVFCCNPDQEVRQVALAGLGVNTEVNLIAYRLFHPSDTDEAAVILSRRVMN